MFKQKLDKKWNVTNVNTDLIFASITGDDMTKDFNVPLSPISLEALYNY